MPVELKVLGYAALLQFVQLALMAVPVNLQLGVKYTGGNRDEQKQPWGVVARILYVPAYASGVFLWRSLIWGVGFFATLLMLLAALF